MGENGITTGQTPDHLVAKKGFKQVHVLLVTVADVFSTSEIYTPPIFIFPRAKLREHFLNGASQWKYRHCKPFWLGHRGSVFTVFPSFCQI